VPSDPPRPTIESNSVPTKTAVAALGMLSTPAASRTQRAPFHFAAFGPCWARWNSSVSAWVFPPPNWVVMLKTADDSVWMPESRRTASPASPFRFLVR